MHEVPRVVASRKSSWFTVVLRDDGLLVYHPIPGAVITHQRAREILELGLQLVDRPSPALVMMQDVGRVDREARAFFASEEYLRLASQTALVVGSPVSRVIGNFFVGLNRLKYPCRVFDDTERAEQWLRGFVS